jgi:hypothetical protein
MRMRTTVVLFLDAVVECVGVVSRTRTNGFRRLDRVETAVKRGADEFGKIRTRREIESVRRIQVEMI